MRLLSCPTAQEGLQAVGGVILFIHSPKQAGRRTDVPRRKAHHGLAMVVSFMHGGACTTVQSMAFRVHGAAMSV